jgi:hypothetical protein
MERPLFLLHTKSTHFYHKRGRPKFRRADCLLCKLNKLGQGMENKLGHIGFSKIRKEAIAKCDLQEVDREV